MAPLRRPSLIEPWRFRFLNETREIRTRGDWNAVHSDRLWLYNLHYFDDLNAEGQGTRVGLHGEWIARWVRENPPGGGVGWEPYPVSLRMVNWIKWALREHALPEGALASLANQARFLVRNLEFHLLGNHLLANAKALVFAGALFDGPEAREWLTRGTELFDRELREQVLDDGGHFELSPMYHAIVLEDLLDVIHLHSCYRMPLPPGWKDTAGGMIRWLMALSHPDGEIAFFNDAAFGVAPRPDRLYAFARLADVDFDPSPLPSLVHLAESGFVRISNEKATALLRVGPIGPDYLPAHAHADSLSFEVSLDGARLLVNSGTSTYTAGARRSRERATSAHNTVAVDRHDSSEVWASFRVARRARPVGTEVGESPLRVRGGHDGYVRLRGKPLHRREWVLDADRLTLRDTLAGAGRHLVEVYFHAHPAFRIAQMSKTTFELLARDGDRRVATLHTDPRAQAEIQSSSFGAEFGKAEPNQRVVCSCSGSLPVELTTILAW